MTLNAWEIELVPARFDGDLSIRHPAIFDPPQVVGQSNEPQQGLGHSNDAHGIRPADQGHRMPHVDFELADFVVRALKSLRDRTNPPVTVAELKRLAETVGAIPEAFQTNTRTEIGNTRHLVHQAIFAISSRIETRRSSDHEWDAAVSLAECWQLLAKAR